MSLKNARSTAQALEPPSLDEDPAERKRQLNVLAQRRYRRRKREILQKLERVAAGQGTDAVILDATSSVSPSLIEVVPRDTSARGGFVQEIGMSSLEWPDPNEDFTLDAQFNTIDCFDPSSLDAYDMSLEFPLPSLSSSSTLSSSRSPRSPASSSSTQSDRQPMSRDELHLPMLQLALLRGMMTLAKRLEIDHLVFDPHAKSPFCLPNNTPFSQYLRLPANLRPTAQQLSTPHHPALDLLPWPEVRDKLIMVFSQPVEFRPPSARSPTAFVEFVYDLEDSAEGVRIWGDDPAEESNWEVGEKVYDRWWWALSGEVVTQANAWREMRGARLLGDSVR